MALGMVHYAPSRSKRDSVSVRRVLIGTTSGAIRSNAAADIRWGGPVVLSSSPHHVRRVVSVSPYVEMLGVETSGDVTCMKHEPFGREVEIKPNERRDAMHSRRSITRFVRTAKSGLSVTIRSNRSSPYPAAILSDRSVRNESFFEFFSGVRRELLRWHHWSIA